MIKIVYSPEKDLVSIDYGNGECSEVQEIGPGGEDSLIVVHDSKEGKQYLVTLEGYQTGEDGPLKPNQVYQVTGPAQPSQVIIDPKLVERWEEEGDEEDEGLDEDSEGEGDSEDEEDFEFDQEEEPEEKPDSDESEEDSELDIEDGED